MFPLFSKDDLSFQKDVRKFALQLNTEQKEGTFFSRESWHKCAKFGITALFFPEKYGGLESNLAKTAMAIETLGEECIDRGLVFSLCAHLFACGVPLWKFGNEKQKEKFLTKMINGKIIAANAMTEAESGSDAFSLQTTAKKVAGGYKINGSKIYSTNAPIADLIICYAKTSPDLGYLGITAFAIPSKSPGITMGNNYEKIGLTSSPMGAIYFDDCYIAEENRIGNEGNGTRIFEISMGWERTFLFAFYVGLMKRLWQMCLHHAHKRKQFKQKLTSFQAISHKIVNMKLRWETSQYLLYKAVYTLENNLSSHTMDSCLAKLHISEAAVQSGLDAIHIHGGYGTITESGIEQMLRDAIPATIFSGTNEIMKEKIISELIKEL